MNDNKTKNADKVQETVFPANIKPTKTEYYTDANGKRRKKIKKLVKILRRC